jgi:hypothetical protein
MAQSPGKFSRTGNLTTTRQFHTATLLTNGRVLITSGFAVPPPFSVRASAELYVYCHRRDDHIAGLPQGHSAQ